MFEYLQIIKTKQQQNLVSSSGREFKTTRAGSSFSLSQKHPQRLQVVAVRRYILILKQNHSSDCKESELE